MRVRSMKRYDDAFREQAVNLLDRTDRSLGEVASSLGVPYATLHYWYRQRMAKKRKKPGAASSSPTMNAASSPTTVAAVPETLQQKLARLERENAALRKENEDLKLDRDILKKAAAFFVKEST